MSNLAEINENPIGTYAVERMEKIVEERFTDHPFLSGVSKENAREVLADYLGMSKAFPFLAAGAQRDLILDVIENNTDIPQELEVTSVVSNFLSWDETGGHAIVSRHGNPGLPRILNTKRSFHGNMLQNDLDKLFPVPIAVNFSQTTKEYLKKLLSGLGSIDPVTRAGVLTAFEMHAEQMISSLWKRMIELYGTEGEDLLYFKIHVGEDDPAEPYHVAMTQKMIDQIVGNGPDADEKVERFLKAFEEGYALNFNWTKAITELTPVA